MQIAATINGEKKTFESDPNRRLADVLRDDFRLLRTKIRCEQGVCGACTIRINGKIALSCLIPAALAQNAEIETLESFEKTDDFCDIKSALENRNIFLSPESMPAISFGIDEILKKTKKNLAKKTISRGSTQSFFSSGTEKSASPQIYEKLAREFFTNWACGELDFANLLTTIRLAAIYRAKRLKNEKN